MVCCTTHRSRIYTGNVGAVRRSPARKRNALWRRKMRYYQSPDYSSTPFEARHDAAAAAAAVDNSDVGNVEGGAEVDGS